MIIKMQKPSMGKIRIKLKIIVGSIGVVDVKNDVEFSIII